MFWDLFMERLNRFRLQHEKLETIVSSMQPQWTEKHNIVFIKEFEVGLAYKGC